MIALNFIAIDFSDLGLMGRGGLHHYYQVGMAVPVPRSATSDLAVTPYGCWLGGGGCLGSAQTLS